MFLGGTGKFTTYGRSLDGGQPDASSSFGGDVVTVIESEKKEQGVYLAMVAAVAQKGREDHWRTQVELTTSMFSENDLQHVLDSGGVQLKVEQWTMNSSHSVVEQVIRDLKKDHPEYLREEGSKILPTRFDALLTEDGLQYVQRLDVLNAYWKLHAETFQPKVFEGTWSVVGGGVTFVFSVEAPCVVVLSVKLEEM